MTQIGPCSPIITFLKAQEASLHNQQLSATSNRSAGRLQPPHPALPEVHCKLCLLPEPYLIIKFACLLGQLPLQSIGYPQSHSKLVLKFSEHSFESPLWLYNPILLSHKQEGVLPLAKLRHLLQTVVHLGIKEQYRAAVSCLLKSPLR